MHSTSCSEVFIRSLWQVVNLARDQALDMLTPFGRIVLKFMGWPLWEIPLSKEPRIVDEM